MDTQKIRELITKRDAIDKELVELVTGNGSKKPIKCSTCGDEGHTARTCTKREAAPPVHDAFAGQ